ncbi:MAG: hypothetical protein H6719_08385 [Sandaracinaceae bacterium]|nr:hypothetical protein [Sandaracinaceae bacterium]
MSRPSRRRGARPATVFQRRAEGHEPVLFALRAPLETGRDSSQSVWGKTARASPTRPAARTVGGVGQALGLSKRAVEREWTMIEA